MSSINQAVQTKLISEFLEKHPSLFEECHESLKYSLKTIFPSLLPENNPIVRNLKDIPTEQIAFIIKEYSCFSQEAIHMLLDAMIRNHDWKELFLELQRNIDEEKGQETKGIPHLEMMRQGYKIDLGIETDNVEFTDLTLFFVKKMKRIFNHNDNAFSAGALLAFEGSAIPEFYILDQIVKEYNKKRNVAPQNDKVSLTRLYIDGHKDFEIGHEAHLASSIKPYINELNINKMVKGYFSVCYTMSTWWEQLALESFLFSSSSTFLKVDKPEIYPIAEDFK